MVIWCINPNCIYSAQQAAIIGADGKHFYRGNYDSSCDCNVKSPNIVEISLMDLLDQHEVSVGNLANN